MLTTCPECQGKLSTAAPSCPHCGYEQKNVAAHAPTATSAASAEVKTDPLLPVILPSPAALKKSSRQVFAEWSQSPAAPMLGGALLLVVALVLISLVLLWALNGSARHSRAGQLQGSEFRDC